MENSVRTVYGAALQTALLLRLPLPILGNTTLNEELSIQQNVLLAQNELPFMGYAAIGNGGHKMVQGANGISKPEPIQHKPTDSGLYNQIPFVLRTVDNDLSPTERAKYGLRRIETHGAHTYIAYYLKRLNYTNVSVLMDYNTVNNGVTTATAFIPTSSNLHPIPPDLANTGVNVTTGDYVSVTAKIPFTLTETEVTEILNAAMIMYGDDGYAIISEVALCSGVDKIVSVDATGSGTTINFNEVIAAQVVSFVNAFYSMKFTNVGVNVLFDVGATEPLYVISSPPNVIVP